MAGLLLRERVAHLWAPLPAPHKSELKAVMLDLVLVEQAPAVREALSRVVAYVSALFNHHVLL